MENYERKRVGHGARGEHTCPRRGPLRGRAWAWWGRLGTPLRLVFVLFPSFYCKTFSYIITRTSRGPYIVFSSCFVSSCFCQDLFSALEVTMDSTNNDEGKELSGDDLQDPKLEEEIKSEAEEEEESRRPYPRTTVASIGVLKSSHKIGKGARMSTGGRFPCHILAERTLTSGNKNPFP